MYSSVRGREGIVSNRSYFGYSILLTRFSSTTRVEDYGVRGGGCINFRDRPCTAARGLSVRGRRIWRQSRCPGHHREFTPPLFGRLRTVRPEYYTTIVYTRPCYGAEPTGNDGHPIRITVQQRFIGTRIGFGLLKPSRCSTVIEKSHPVTSGDVFNIIFFQKYRRFQTRQSNTFGWVMPHIVKTSE